MPSSFSSFNDGDVILASHVAEMHGPIQNLERGAAFYAGLSSGTSSAYTANLSLAPDSAYPAGMMVHLKIHSDNGVGSPDVTLNLNGVGAKPIVKKGAALKAGDLKANQMVALLYNNEGDGRFEMLAAGDSLPTGTEPLVVEGPLFWTKTAYFVDHEVMVTVSLDGDVNLGLDSSANGHLEVWDENGNYVKYRIQGTSVSKLSDSDAGSTEYVVDPGSGELGVFVDSGNLNFGNHTGTAREIALHYRGRMFV
jgi:hypothetical protein